MATASSLNIRGSRVRSIADALVSEGSDFDPKSAEGERLIDPAVSPSNFEVHATALLLFPTKALCQDQFKNFSATLEAVGLSERMAGVFDGDTPGNLRRNLEQLPWMDQAQLDRLMHPPPEDMVRGR